MKNYVVLLLVLLFSFGCSTSSRKSASKLKGLVIQKKYDEALKLVKSDKYYPEKRSQLLKLLEIGTLHFYKGNYYQAIQTFDSAHELSDKLYIKSLSKKLLTMVANDSADNYYGERYERSLIRFYLSFSHYMIYQTGRYEAYVKTKRIKKGKKEKETQEKHKEKKLSKRQRRSHLFSARAMIIEWDSLLTTYKNVHAGNTTYKNDLAAKIFGSFIHQRIGGSGERQVALQLYKDAKKVLFRNYNTYPVFNSKSAKFRKDYSKLPTLPEKNVKRDYVGETKFSKNINNFLNAKIKDLSKNRLKDNINVLVLSNFIAKKQVKKISFPIQFPGVALARAHRMNKRKVGIVGFTMDVLGLAAGTKPAIAFEMPMVRYKKTSNSMKIIVKNLKGKKIKEVPLVIINPLSDIAYEALDNKLTALYAKTGARVAAKHIAAITSAYVGYKTSVAAGTPPFIAKLGASAAYALANKGIEASERADLRFWSTLPHTIRMTSFRLRKGKYKIYILKTDFSGNSVEMPQGDLVVTDRNAKLYNFNI